MAIGTLVDPTDIAWRASGRPGIIEPSTRPKAMAAKIQTVRYRSRNERRCGAGLTDILGDLTLFGEKPGIDRRDLYVACQATFDDFVVVPSMEPMPSSFEFNAMRSMLASGRLMKAPMRLRR